MPTAALNDPLRIGSMRVRNRLYRAPVLEGRSGEADFVAPYLEHFLPNARTGIGLVVTGSSCVDSEGLTAPGMVSVDSWEKVKPFGRLTRAMREHGTRIVMQLGHGGYFALEGWHRAYRAKRRKPLIGPSPLRFPLSLMLRPVRALSAEEVYELAERFGRSAAWAREAGFDGVQLGAANAKLLNQFLSPHWNRRTDEFGGSAANRARVLKAILDAVRRRAGRDFAVLTKLPVLDGAISLEDAVETARLCEAWGFDALTPVASDRTPNTRMVKGGFPEELYLTGAVGEQFREAVGSRWKVQALRLLTRSLSRSEGFVPVWNREVFSAVKRAVSIPVFAVGGIRSSTDIRSVLGPGQADMVGLARPFYAEPELARRLLAEDERPSLCTSSNRCVFIGLGLGNPGRCYNPEVLKKRAALAAA